MGLKSLCAKWTKDYLSPKNEINCMLDSKSGDLSRVLKEGLQEKNGPALKEFSCKILQTAKAT